jgi:alpha-N-arabinofuranosidase
VVVGDLLMTLLANADRVTSASLAQLVNVIAPIMTEPGGGAWRQTTFFPFSVTSRLAKGVVLRPRIEVATYETAVHGTAALVHSIATWDEQTGRTAVFLVNRDLLNPITVSIDMMSLDATQIIECTSLFDPDPYAKNTSDDRERVALQTNTTGELKDGILRVTLAPISWTAVALA